MSANPGASAVGLIPELPPSLDMNDIETWANCRAMKPTNGNVSHAAKLLGISRDTLHTKLKKLKEEKGIDRYALTNTPAPVGTPEPIVAGEA